MTTTAALPSGTRHSRGRSWFASKGNDGVVLTRRSLIHIASDPMQLSDATVQPILFTLLSIQLDNRGDRDPSEDHFRPHDGCHRPVLHAGHAAGSSSRRPIGGGRLGCRSLHRHCCGARAGGRLAPFGWRPDAGAPSALGGFAVALIFAYAPSWVCACLGIRGKSPEPARGVGLIILFPIAVVSDALVPTAGMPGWLQSFANWNPVSSVVAAVRRLFGTPDPSSSISAWPMQRSVQATLVWSVAILAVFAPLAAYLFRRRTTGRARALRRKVIDRARCRRRPDGVLRSRAVLTGCWPLPYGVLPSTGQRRRRDARLYAAASRTRSLNAVSSTVPPARTSMARLRFPSRLALKSPAGSSRNAPFANVSFT